MNETEAYTNWMTISEAKAPNAFNGIEQHWVSDQKVTANASSDLNLNLVIITLDNFL